MKQHPRTILKLAIAYMAVVVVVDFFVSKVPAIDWLALSVVFIFFAILIASSVVGLLPRRRLTAKDATHKREDELERLEKTVERALVEGDRDSLIAIEKRVMQLALRVSARRAGKDAGKLHLDVENAAQLVSRAPESDLLDNVSTSIPTALEKPNSGNIERLLSQIEASLS
jgi:hypothetical protein